MPRHGGSGRTRLHEPIVARQCVESDQQNNLAGALGQPQRALCARYAAKQAAHFHEHVGQLGTNRVQRPGNALPGGKSYV